jgi:hypothetical protein
VDLNTLATKNIVLSWEYIYIDKYFAQYPSKSKDAVEFQIYRAQDAQTNTRTNSLTVNPGYPPLLIKTININDALMTSRVLVNNASNIYCLSVQNSPLGSTSPTKPTIITSNPIIKQFSMIDDNTVEPANKAAYLYYWIQAVFDDGSVSEMAGPIKVFYDYD